MAETTSGFLLIDKPSGITSHDVIDYLRKITGLKKIGHAGTLDPFATGLLIVAVGREATKKLTRLIKLDKEYLASLHLGLSTDTYDRTGKIMDKYAAGRRPRRKEIKDVLMSFIGEQEQIPPMYSAKKVGGRKLYQLARRGLIIKRPPVKIKIYDIKLIEYTWPKASIKVHSSPGTYVRVLAHDIGRALGTGACLEELRRLAIGKIKIKQALKLGEIKPGNWQTKLIDL